MATRGKFFTSMSFGLVASLAAIWPAQAQGDIEEQIKALEAEVQKIEPLKDQIERLRYQQLEMKKEATAAAAAIPTFTYRPGSGVTIAGADKSWSWNLAYRMDVLNYNRIDGKPNFNDGGAQRNTGASFGDLYVRRNRLYMNMCWQDCFYEFTFAMDGETAPRRMSARDAELKIDFSQRNPWLPYLSVGPRRGAGRTHIGRSSSSDGKMEHGTILEAFGWGGAGSHAGAGLGWEAVAIGPGEYELYLNYASSQQETHFDFQPSDRKGIMAFIGGKPFSKIKNKWLSGLDIGLGYQGHSLDRPENHDPSEGGYRVRLRDNERKTRATYWEPGGLSSGDSEQNVGKGWADVLIPGVKWTVGPYFFRAVYLSTRFANVNNPPSGRGIWGTGWTIDHQLNLWSPKGWFTGGPRNNNSIVAAFGFERAVVDCGRGCDASPGSGSFHHNQITEKSVALWYWVNRGLGVGMWWTQWTSTNTPYRTQVTNGCKDNRTDALAGKGVSRSCTAHALNTGLRFFW